jgi:hypothetical protein
MLLYSQVFKAKFSDEVIEERAMPYLAYGPDMRRAWIKFRKPAKNWTKSLAKIRDPFKLFWPTATFVVHGFILSGKALFFTMRKLLNR